ncbi:PREDICTED: suppressor protein SRP40-like, partial [Amphimedon queenslandica]|uniref:Uncharacterized protein n=1 Tax=Amphimedon queenslandica TaxID=400682 RepID=A0AAN0IR09_AMPQE
MAANYDVWADAVVKEQAVKGKKFKKPKKRPKRLHVVQPSNKASKKQATEVDTSSSSSDYKDMEIVKIGKKAPPAKKKDDSSSSSDKTDIEDTTPSKLVAKPTNDAKKCDLSDNSSSDDDSEETKEPAKASTKRKQEESESDDDCSDESETHNVPLTKKMKKGGLGSIGGHSMSKASEPELLSNLRAIHETIRSLDEQIKLVSEKISCYQDIRKSCWTSYTETNVPETTSWELSIVWELDNGMDEDEEQQVELSENRTLSQLFASMMTAAGQVAARSIQRGRYCKEIIIYGVI